MISCLPIPLQENQYELNTFNSTTVIYFIYKTIFEHLTHVYTICRILIGVYFISFIRIVIEEKRKLQLYKHKLAIFSLAHRVVI